MAQQTTTEKDVFVNAWEQEFQITKRVLKDFPAGHEDFRATEKSLTARELVWKFIGEGNVMIGALTGNVPSGSPPPAPPDSIAALARRYDDEHRGFADKLHATPEEQFNRTVSFPVGPGKMADVRAAQVAWMMLMDQVHHRGQLTVYMRLLGGRVPAIYGPSADEPWR